MLTIFQNIDLAFQNQLANKVLVNSSLHLLLEIETWIFNVDILIITSYSMLVHVLFYVK
jgi:hypothetical protein